jgi:hypothetical protein
MKRSVSSDTLSKFNKATLEKILTIEKEVMELKLFVLRKLEPTGEKIIKLKGLVPNVGITEEDIAFAKSVLTHYPQAI